MAGVYVCILVTKEDGIWLYMAVYVVICNLKTHKSILIYGLSSSDDDTYASKFISWILISRNESAISIGYNIELNINITLKTHTHISKPVWNQNSYSNPVWLDTRL